MKQTSFEIVRAQAKDAAALLEYLKIIGGETDNLSFGAEGVPLCACSTGRLTMLSILPRWMARSSARQV